MPYDLSVLDALEQKIVREGTSLHIRTRNRITGQTVHTYEFTNAPVAPTPQEVEEVARAIRTAIALNIPSVVGGQVVAPSGEPVSGGSGSSFTLNETTGFAETQVSGQTFLALSKDGPNAKANVNHRTGTFSQLTSLVGGNGEIAVCSDERALFVYDGVAAGGTVYRPSSQVGVLSGSLVFPETIAPVTPILADTSEFVLYTPGVLSQAANLTSPEIAVDLPGGAGNTILRVEGRAYRAVQHNVIPSSIDGYDSLNVEYHQDNVGDVWTPQDSLYFDASREISYATCSVTLPAATKRIRFTMSPQITSPSYLIVDLQVYVYSAFI